MIWQHLSTLALLCDVDPKQISRPCQCQDEGGDAASGDEPAKLKSQSGYEAKYKAWMDKAM